MAHTLPGQGLLDAQTSGQLYANQEKGTLRYLSESKGWKITSSSDFAADAKFPLGYVSAVLR
jgi:hypothetical protein